MCSCIHLFDFLRRHLPAGVAGGTIPRGWNLACHGVLERLADGFLCLADSGNRIYALAGYVCRTFQLGGYIGHFQRITVQVYVTSVRTGRGFHAHKGSGGHLSAGHTVDGVIDEDDGDVLTAVQRMDGFGRTDTCQVAVA